MNMSRSSCFPSTRSLPVSLSNRVLFLTAYDPDLEARFLFFP